MSHDESLARTLEDRRNERLEESEVWWVSQATKMAAKMKAGGVKEFRIFLNYKGKYEFEIVPIDPQTPVG